MTWQKSLKSSIASLKSIQRLSIDKAATLAPDQFGYLSVHKIVRLRKARRDLPEWRNFRDLVAEIQIRTVLQHSWAAISHALQYKNEADVPAQSRRRLSLLAGLLELGDREFAALRTEKSTLSDLVGREVEKGRLDIPVDAVSVKEFLDSSIEARKLAKLAEDRGMVIAQESGPGDVGISQTVAACRMIGIRTIKELRAKLQTFDSFAASFFHNFMKGRPSISTTGSLGHVTAIALLAAQHALFSAADIVKEVGWSTDYAQGVLKHGKAMTVKA